MQSSSLQPHADSLHTLITHRCRVSETVSSKQRVLSEHTH